eukprot:6085483-Amphidinium_carterae.1
MNESVSHSNANEFSYSWLNWTEVRLKVQSQGRVQNITSSVSQTSVILELVSDHDVPVTLVLVTRVPVTLVTLTVHSCHWLKVPSQ